MATNIKEVNLFSQRGNGIPNHIAIKSTIFFDIDTAILYINKDGAANWKYFLDSSMSITGSSSGDTYVTGFTYDNANNLTLHRNDGINISVNFSTFTGLTATTISATTFYGDGSNLTGISGSSDTNTFVTGGTTNNSTKTYTFTNSTGGTFNVTALTDINTTGVTFTNNLLSINNNTGGTNTVLINTMTGLTINGTLDFGTGSTIPSNVSGRVFYNNLEQALAYYPNANQDVIVNIGQQQYIRVNNASGTIISKGSVVNAITASGGTPSITLALSTGLTGNNVIGLAAHNIGVGSQGLVLTNGLLSGLTINTFSVGDVIYLSDTTPGGYISNTSSLLNNSRINEIGYITATGTSLGQIFVNIKNENSNELLTIKQKNLLVEDALSTGVYIFTGLTRVTSTTFSVAPVSGWIVNNTGAVPLSGDIINVIYTGVTATTTPYLATADVTYILVTSANTLTQQTTFPTPTQRRNSIYLGKILHSNRTSIDFVLNTPDFDVSPISQLRDVMTPIKLINDGVVASANGVNLSFNTSAGTLYGLGINWCVNTLTPDSLSITASTPTTFQYRVQTGGTFTDTTLILPNNYDLNGIVTTVGGGVNRSTNQRIYLYPNNLFRIQYGQTIYNSLTEAITSVSSESFAEFTPLANNAILIGILSVRRSATDLSSSSDAKFTFSSKFGEVFGGTGGVSTTTLQQAYENSTVPQITTNSTLDGLSIQNGTGNADNITNNLKIFNAVGGTTSFMRANGDISGNTISATTITATTISAVTYSNIKSNISGTFDGQGGVLTTGSTSYVTMTNSGSFKGWYILSPLSGNLIVDVWKAAGAIPTVANSIAGSERPTLTSQTVNSDTNLTTWTTTRFAQGDIVALQISSASTITYANIVLQTTNE